MGVIYRERKCMLFSHSGAYWIWLWFLDWCPNKPEKHLSQPQCKNMCSLTLRNHVYIFFLGTWSLFTLYVAAMYHQCFLQKTSQLWRSDVFLQTHSGQRQSQLSGAWLSLTFWSSFQVNNVKIKPGKTQEKRKRGRRKLMQEIQCFLQKGRQLFPKVMLHSLCVPPSLTGSRLGEPF